MDTKLNETPHREKAFIKNKVLQFRHPWVKGNDGRGKVVRRGVGKLSEVAQAEVCLECQTILDRAPRLRADAPATVRQMVADAYFNELDIIDAGPDEYAVTQGVLNDVETQHIQAFKKGYVAPMPDLEAVRTLVENLRIENESLKREVQRLKEAAVKNQQALGERSLLEKNSTIESCLAHWKKFFKAGSENETYQKIRRVSEVCKLLGMKKTIASISKADIQAAIDAHGKKDFELTKVVQAVKKFFKDLTNPQEEDGLGFSSNPAQNITAEAVGTIQNRKLREEDAVPIIDPREILKLELTDYMKALLPLLALAGAV